MIFIYLFISEFVCIPLSRVAEVAYLVAGLVDHHWNLHLVVVCQNQLQWHHRRGQMYIDPPNKISVRFE